MNFSYYLSTIIEIKNTTKNKAIALVTKIIGIARGNTTHHQDIVKNPNAFAVNNIRNIQTKIFRLNIYLFF